MTIYDALSALPKIQIVHIVKHEVLNEAIADTFNNSMIFEIDGMAIHTLEEGLINVSKLFQFPEIVTNLDGFLDWFSDLEWLHLDNHIMIIIKYSHCNVLYEHNELEFLIFIDSIFNSMTRFMKGNENTIIHLVLTHFSDEIRLYKAYKCLLMDYFTSWNAFDRTDSRYRKPTAPSN